MIIFDLACEHQHKFEGWFSSQSSYEDQLNQGLVTCPQCGSTIVHRVPSAVHLARPSHSAAAKDPVPVSNAHGGLLATYQQVLSNIISNSDDVGKNFPEEARKIFYEEAPKRLIRGEASAEEFESLREEGIDVLRLPIFKKEELN